jgi:hypothetical protein
VEILYRMTLAINLTELVKVLAGDVGFQEAMRMIRSHDKVFAEVAR